MHSQIILMNTLSFSFVSVKLEKSLSSFGVSGCSIGVDGGPCRRSVVVAVPEEDVEGRVLIASPWDPVMPPAVAASGPLCLLHHM